MEVLIMSIVLRKEYVDALDAALCAEAKTTILSGRSDLVKAGANANEILIPKMGVGKLKDYSKGAGFGSSTPSLTWQTVQSDFDRGDSVVIDAVDDAESAHILYANYAKDFIRRSVAPELDAYRFAKYASKANIGSAEATLTTGEQVRNALRVAVDGMVDAGAANDKVLFIRKPLLSLIEDMDDNKSRKVLESFTNIIDVPAERFYTAINQLDGTSDNDGGYEKAEGAADINFLIVSKEAVVQFDKHIATNIYDSKETYFGKDGFLYSYRLVTIADILDEKVPAVYVHTAPIADDGED